MELAINDTVEVGDTPIIGTIVGKTEYAASVGFPTNYLVRSVDRSTGLPRDDWFGSEQLRPCSTEF